ncbi:MAG: VWA domain-containing protein [Bernardetiaceae bacterium]
MSDWLSLHWFSVAQLKSYTWESPLFLYAIAFVPLLWLLRWAFRWGRNQQLEVALSARYLRNDPITYLRHLPKLFFSLFLALVLVALARPQINNERVEQWSEGIDICLALDISGSMQIQDFLPNRLEAAKRVAKEFVEGRFQDRIGVVIFAGDAYSLAPLTTDYELLISYIESINFNMIQSGGTAIGSALAVSTNRLREQVSSSKVLILLSDGENTAGSIDPITAAEIAEAYDIKIYTIGVGRDGRVPQGTDIFGQTYYAESNLDETGLRKIAQIGHGEYFRATNEAALASIFDRIDRYEKTEIKENRFQETKDFYEPYLFWALLFFLMWLAFKSSFLMNLLED